MFQLINDEKPTSEDRKLRLIEGGVIVAGLAIVVAVFYFALQGG
jgi:hypothetical protein